MREQQVVGTLLKAPDSFQAASGLVAFMHIQMSLLVRSAHAGPTEALSGQHLLEPSGHSVTVLPLHFYSCSFAHGATERRHRA